MAALNSVGSRKLLKIGLVMICAGSVGCRPSDAPEPTPDSNAVLPVDADAGGKRLRLSDIKVAPRVLDASQSHVETPSTIPPLFTDVHREVGLEFVFDNGASPRKLMPEATSGGGGWIDYDKDGWPDVYLPQGGDPAPASADGQPVDQLFRNLLGQRFENVTHQAGLLNWRYGHGVVIGDFDNDGFEDVYISNVGEDVLYWNLGDGTFEDVTQAAGISNELWASSAAWGDLTGNGLLDLYVCNYVDYDPFHPTACFDNDGKPGTCHPKDVGPVPNRCFINQGDGTFREEADARGLNGPGSKSLGVVIADLTGNGLPDVYVANDTTANHLFVNQGNGRFQEQALPLGAAMSGLGQFQASMGVAFGDYDRNGRPDLYVTHFTKDSNTLYRNLSEAGFSDATREVGLHLPTMNYLGFGTVMADFTLNGREDLFVSNGHIDDWRELNDDDWEMAPQVFSFDGSRWHEHSQVAGDYFQHTYLGRAVATADYNKDGSLDLLVVHQNRPVGLLRNDSPRGNWLQFEFVGTQSNRQGIGTEVTVLQTGEKWVSQLPGGTSYCASHQPLLVFGFGESAQPCDVEIRWPSGRRQTLTGVTVNQRVTVFEGDAE